MKVVRVDKLYRLETSIWLPVAPNDLFPFFTDACNLEQLTPPHMSFSVLTPRPIVMGVGTLIDYKLRIRGFPVRWRTEITEWDPPHRFADNQLRGPYNRWYHTHTFAPDRGGTLCSDVVEYLPPGGPLTPLVNTVFVRRDVEAVFRYRESVLRQLYDPCAGAP